MIHFKPLPTQSSVYNIQRHMLYERANVPALDTGLFFCASTKKKTKSAPDGVKDFDSYIKGLRTSLIH